MAEPSNLFHTLAMPTRAIRLRHASLAVIFAGCAARTAPSVTQTTDWPTTGGASGNSHYSPLGQIDRGNVSSLHIAWTYHSGDASADNRSQIQATPIVVDGVLYATTPSLDVIALHAENGVELWRFDPFAGGARESHVNRGVFYWSDARDRRIFFSAGRRLYSLDASTGRPVTTFGADGWVDL